MTVNSWEPKLKEQLPESPALIPTMIWQYLFNQGVRTSEEIDLLFSPTLKKLTNPFKILNMQKLVDRLLLARSENQKICIYGDFDLDGTSGVALLLKGLEGLGFQDVTYYQPKRISEGYGVHVAAIEKLSEQGVKVILTVDVGITDVKAAEKAKELGIDFLITDHHLPKPVLPDAFTIVNPNQVDCTSKLTFLCGAGVAFYAILALKIELEKNETIDFNPKQLLDFFTIATITDMVPLIKENRVLIKHGLKQLQNTKSVGLKALLDYLNLSDKKELTSTDIAFRFAPKLNALSRLELGILPIDIYLAENAKSAKILIKKMIQINEKRIKLQRSAEIEAEKKIIAHGLDDFVLVCSKNFHKGVIGLVATRLSQKYNVPAFVGSIDESGEVTGSSRIPRESKINLLDALESSKEALIRFGGHAPAAGYLFAQEQEDNFRTCLKGHFQKLKKEKTESPEIKILFDAQGSLDEINESFMNWYEMLGPFGSHFETPIFKSKKLVLNNLKKLKGGHFKLSLRDPESSKSVDGLWFTPPEGHPFEDEEKNIDKLISVLYEPQWNYYNGKKTIQILIKDLKVD